MKAYVLMSGVLYLLLVLAHVARVVAEGTSVVRNPTFAATTVAAVLMTGWSWRLFQQVRHGSAG